MNRLVPPTAVTNGSDAGYSAFANEYKLPAPQISCRSKHRDGGCFGCLENLMGLHHLAVIATASNDPFGSTPAQRDNTPEMMVDRVSYGIVEHIAVIIGGDNQIDRGSWSDSMRPLDIKAGFLCP